MKTLRRVEWAMGQALLPHHLEALEDSVLAYARSRSGGVSPPDYGVVALELDPALLSSGMVSIGKLVVQFQTGHRLDTSDNAVIQPFDLNHLEKTQVRLYLHLLKEGSTQEVTDQETGQQLSYGMYDLQLSDKSTIQGAIATMEFGAYKKKLEGQWTPIDEDQPPFLNIGQNPFFKPLAEDFVSQLSQYEKVLKERSVANAPHQRLDLKNRLCLLELHNIRRLLVNIDKGLVVHPYYLYEALYTFCDMVALMMQEQQSLPPIAPYTHEKPGSLFKELLQTVKERLKIKTEKYSSLQLEKRNQFYISEKLPADLLEASEIYLVVQPVDAKQRGGIIGVKVGALSRLPNMINLALSGVKLVTREHSVLGNNFPKEAHIYEIKKDSEWSSYVAKERSLGLSVQGGAVEIQAFIYWRS